LTRAASALIPICGDSSVFWWLEDRIGDIILPPNPDPAPEDTVPEVDVKLSEVVRMLGGQFVGPSRLLDLSRNLKVTEEARLSSAQNLTTGKMELGHQSEHKDVSGGTLKVPPLFLLWIPVFDRGAAYRIPVRLRYRLSGSKLTWYVIRYRPQLSFDDALSEDIEQVREGTGLPVYSGALETT
jgi:hypothetical protein